ncbi:MAG TPA: STAS domain-containing protein [Steroidobacteraceae bacterium]|nr:STAS domain-containing protein [Steroidobacteraceae bacterium]
MSPTAPQAANEARGIELRPGADGGLAVVGELTFKTARVACAVGEQALRTLSPSKRVRIDCAGVERADSAGVAVLIEWLRLARRSGRDIQYVTLPASVLAIARISELDKLLLADP